MRADAAGAKTWMLGALALWALALWVLGLFGLGSRIDRLPADPSLLQRLPGAVPASPERLGGLPQYAEIGDRPLFSNDRRPQPFLINPEGEGEEQDTFEYVLTSVLITPTLQMAIVRPPDEDGEPVRLRVGEAPKASPGWTLASIGPRQVVFNGPDGERTLELRVFDGIGGEPPTAMTAAPGAPAAGGVARPAVPRGGIDAGNRAQSRQAGAIPVTTSSASVMVPAPTPAAAAASASGTGASADGAAGDAAADDQVDAIRRRIEARRAQMREQTQQQEPAPAPVE
ncbi:MAG TPA: hypothetical protein VLK29_10240 [Luteimonas sp.]|nr:hypothetical protein [Luteimonas sp.]